MDAILRRIARELGEGDALSALTERLAPTDLASLLMEVSRVRAAARTPAELMRQWRDDRFVRPSPVDPRRALAVDLAAFDAARGYEPIELSPVSPLGVCSALATVSQHKIVSCARQLEVASDPSNVLALECASRRSRDRSRWARLCTSARVVRAQALARPEHRAHFRIFVMALAGSGPELEETGLVEMIGAQLALLAALAAAGHPTGALEVTISPDARARDAAERAAEALRREHASVPIAIDGARIAASGYYRSVAFGVYVHHAGVRYPLGDGGCTDWVARLTSDRKQKTMVGAIGSELLSTVLAPGRAPGNET